MNQSLDDLPGFMTPPRNSYDLPGFMTPPRNPYDLPGFMTPLKRGLVTPPGSDDAEEGEDFVYLAPPEMLPGRAKVFLDPDPILPYLHNPRIRDEYRRRMDVLHDLIREGDRLAAYVSLIADYNNVSAADAAQNAPDLLRGIVKDLRNATGDYESVRFSTTMKEFT